MRIARKLADGVYLVVAVDESDADEATQRNSARRTPGTPAAYEHAQAGAGLGARDRRKTARGAAGLPWLIRID